MLTGTAGAVSTVAVLSAVAGLAACGWRTAAGLTWGVADVVDWEDGVEDAEGLVDVLT